MLAGMLSRLFSADAMAEDADNRPKFAYFPFGGGSRLCIGEHFAWMEAILAVATLAQHWQLRLEPGHPVVPQPAITLRPGMACACFCKHGESNLCGQQCIRCRQTDIAAPSTRGPAKASPANSNFPGWSMAAKRAGNI